jgi:hypothetical protein
MTTPLTIDELATMWNVKKSWIYSRTANGKAAGQGRGRKPVGKQRQKRERKPLEPIPCFRPGNGRLLRFDLAEVTAWWERWHSNSSGCEPEGGLQSADNMAIKTAINNELTTKSQVSAAVAGANGVIRG